MPMSFSRSSSASGTSKLPFGSLYAMSAVRLSDSLAQTPLERHLSIPVHVLGCAIAVLPVGLRHVDRIRSIRSEFLSYSLNAPAPTDVESRVEVRAPVERGRVEVGPA